MASTTEPVYVAVVDAGGAGGCDCGDAGCVVGYDGGGGIADAWQMMGRAAGLRMTGGDGGWLPTTTTNAAGGLVRWMKIGGAASGGGGGGADAGAGCETDDGCWMMMASSARDAWNANWCNWCSCWRR